MKLRKKIEAIGFILVTTMLILLMPFGVLANEGIGSVHRLAGSNRVETSIEVSRGFYESANTVVIVGWDGMVDALSGTLLANENDGPVIITRSDSLSVEVKEEIKRLGAKKAYILGGTGVVSTKVEKDLLDMGLNTTRLGGLNRQDTAIKVAQEVEKTGFDSAFLVQGWESLADALAIGPVSGSIRKPILLTQSKIMPKETIKAIEDNNINNVTIIGGYNAVSKDVEEELIKKGLNVVRVSGSNRDDTAIKIAEKYLDEGTDTAIFVNGYNSVDALIGGYIASKGNTPILFTNTNAISNTTSDFLFNTNVERGYAIGGVKVLSENVRETIINNMLRIKEANTTTPINIQTPIPHASMSGQTTHPDVAYIEEGWNGHKYWMAHTPYHDTNEAVENPAVSYSDDGINFKTLEGALNPIDSPEDGLVQHRAHMSDPDLIIKPDGSMEVYYRYRDRAKGKGEIIYRKTSKDAINWTEREVVMRGYDDSGDNILSPALIYEDDTYRMWWVDKDVIHTSTSEYGLENTWTPKKEVDLSFRGEEISPWHLDVVKLDQLYHLVLNSNPTDKSRRTLALGVSSDGLSFDNVYTVMRPTESSWDNFDIYRASMIKVDGVYKLYYSATCKNREWYVGLTESKDLKYWNGVKVK